MKKKYQWAIIAAWQKVESQHRGSEPPPVSQWQADHHEPAPLAMLAASLPAGAFDAMGSDDIVVDVESLEVEGDSAAQLEAGSAAGEAAGTSQGLGGSKPASSNPLASLSVAGVISHLKVALGEEIRGIDRLYEKFLDALDRDEVRANSDEI